MNAEKPPYLLEDCPIWKAPNGLHIQGYSRATERSGFRIIDLGIFLDAGLSTWKQANHVFITHGHFDHVAALPTFFPRNKTLQIHCLDELKSFLQEYLNVCQKLNDFDPNAVYFNKQLQWHTFPRVKEEFPIRTASKDLLVKVVPCYHSVPCVGFFFYELRRKLKSEYKGYEAKEIKALNKQGVEITEIQKIPLLGYINDTNKDFLKDLEIDMPILLIECTNMGDGEETDAYLRGHFHLNNLVELANIHPSIIFVPIHFSLKYSKKEIIKLIKNKKCSNIILKFL